MSFQHIADSVRKARKRHKCIWCNEYVEIGDLYHWYCGTFDGDFQHSHAHVECYAAMQRSDPQYLMDGFSPGGHARGQSVNWLGE